MELMLKKLDNDKGKIPTPSRDEIMQMANEAMLNVSVDKTKAFKELFFTNNLDGSEDFMVGDKLFRLIGLKVQEFRKKLMSEEPPKNLEELMRTITPPKGVKRNYDEGK